MPSFMNSKMDTIHYDDSSCEGESCQVRIESGEIVVDYEEDGKRIIYKGSEITKGHYNLSSSDVNGRATLHCFEESTILEGSWVENGSRGMWRIHLA